MALFQKIFHSRRNSDDFGCRWRGPNSDKKWVQPAFDKNQIRLVIFRDNDRSVIFDSKAVHKVEPQEQPEARKNLRFAYSALHRMTQRTPPPDTATPKPAPKYTKSRPSSDVKMLGEMVFGSVAMVYKGSTLKIHSIRSPPQLMVTRVFVPSRVSRESSSEGDPVDMYTCHTPSSELAMSRNSSSSNLAHSVPMDVPISPNRHSSIENEDSGLSTSAASTSSLATSFPSPSSSVTSSSFTSSYNSMHRRWRRNQTTSLEHNLMKRCSDEGVCEVVPAKRMFKFGIAILFSLPEDKEESAKMEMSWRCKEPGGLLNKKDGLTRQFQNFFFSHITLVESHVNKLRMVVEKALYNRKAFIHLVVESLETFRDSMYDLYTSPRLLEPVWLNMMCFTTQRVSLCQHFLKELMISVDKYNTRNTKFFLSTLITAVLTHHLAWVPTVTPAGATPSRTYLDKHSAKWLDTLAKSHPYNPLWAQLGDMYGAIGYPLRLSRTLVVGKRSEVVNRILYILSYFIRCSEVLETAGNHEVHIDDDDDEEFEDEDILSRTWDSDLAARTDLWNLRRHSSGGTLNSPSARRQTSHDNKSVFSYEDMLPGGARCFSGDGLDDPGGGWFPTAPSFVCYLEEECGARHEDTNFICYLPDGSGHCCDDKTALLPGGKCRHGLSAEDSILSTDKHKHSSLDSLSARNYSVSRWLSDTSDCVGTEDGEDKVGMEGEAAGGDGEDISTDASQRLEPTCDTDTNSSSAAFGCDTSDREAVSSGTETVADSTQSQHCERRPSNHDTQDTADIDTSEPVSQNDVPNENPSSAPSHEGECSKSVPVHQRDLSLDSGICDSVGSDASNGELLATLDKHNIPAVIPEESSSCLGSSSPESIAKPVSQSDAALDLSNHHQKAAGEGSDPEVPGACAAPTAGSQEASQEAAGAGCEQGAAGDAPQAHKLLKPCLAPRKDSRDSGHVSCDTRSIATTDNVDYNDNTDFVPDAMLARPAMSPPLESDLVVSSSSSTIHATSLMTDSLESARVRCPDEGLVADCEPLPPEDDSAEPKMLPSTPSDRPSSSEDKMGTSVASQLTVTEDFTSNPPKAERPKTLSLGRVKRPSGPWKESELRQRALSRQNSSASATNPGRCRSVTPTELGRRRHPSGHSTGSMDMTDFWQNLKEVPMPSTGSDSTQDYNIQKFDRNFGRSLLAGYSDHYLSDFALHGTSDDAYLGKLHSDLKVSVKNSVLDEPISESTCIVADTDKWSVKLQSCVCSQPDRIKCSEVLMSDLVCGIIESVHSLWKLKMSPEFCLMHLEDRLQEIYFKSKMLGDYIRLHKKVDPIELTKTFDVTISDLPLLLSVSGTHSPHFALSLM